VKAAPLRFVCATRRLRHTKPGTTSLGYLKNKDGRWSSIFSAGKPWESLAPVWKDVPVGGAVVEVEGVKADAQSVRILIHIWRGNN
jgi:hypothetical protein